MRLALPVAEVACRAFRTAEQCGRSFEIRAGVDSPTTPSLTTANSLSFILVNIHLDSLTLVGICKTLSLLEVLGVG